VSSPKLGGRAQLAAERQIEQEQRAIAEAAQPVFVGDTPRVLVRRAEGFRGSYRRSALASTDRFRA
jgi:hypothetical protein